MAHKTNVVAMLLAGGQGSRLGVLTKNIAKPAVPYGGNYRIIDFPLSNCVNSGIYTVGVLTQYQPLELNDYLGNGQPWDLDRQNGGVHILSPYEAIGGAEWYKGTANAIYQNINFIEKYDPEYVVVLSGDHIYKMNYAKMIDFHKKHNADCTIAVLEVPWEEASRFGILATDEDDRIYEFAEKPAQPKSNKASMGVYVFSWSKLRQYLELDEADPIEQSYYLEVGSPGLGRRLTRPEHYEQLKGQKCAAHLIRPDEQGRRDYAGILQGLDVDGNVTLTDGEETYAFPVKSAGYVKLCDDEDLFG